MNRKIFTTILSFAFLFLFFTSTINAESLKVDSIESKHLITTDHLYKYQLIDDNGVIWTFKNEEGYKLHKEIMREEKLIGISKTKRETLSSVRKNHLWVGYHSGTPNWAKASQYTLNSGKSFSASGSYNYLGFSLNIGFSYSASVNTTIPANASKYSRLGVWGDFTFSKVKVSTYRQGQWHSYETATSVRHNKYIKPRYQ